MEFTCNLIVYIILDTAMYHQFPKREYTSIIVLHDVETYSFCGRYVCDNQFLAMGLVVVFCRTVGRILKRDVVCKVKLEEIGGYFLPFYLRPCFVMLN